MTSTINVDDSHGFLVWVDCEMTGLDIEKDHLIEIACIITDAHLNIIAKSPSIVIHQPKETMDAMDDWCRKHHGDSGLTAKVLSSTITTGLAESTLLEFLQKYVPKGTCPLAGNSVHVDKRFLYKEMPTLVQWLHYRIVDVSTVKELARRWCPQAFSRAPKKKLTHRALDDIEESIEELRFYKDRMFRPVE